MFTPVHQPGPGVVIVKKTTGSNTWHAGDTLHGKNTTNGPGTNILHLKDGSAYDTLVHEIGHLLGLAHEHDRMDPEGNKYRATLKAAFKDEVAQKANKEKQYKNYGPFDSDLIMCYGTKNTTGPSPGDRATLKGIYGW